MPAQISIKIKNYDAIRLAWKLAPAKLGKNLHTAVQKTVLKIEKEAKREAPVNKQSGGGNLRQSIKGRMTGMASGVVEVGAEYAMYVHEGTRPHMIRAVRRRVLANKRTGDVFGPVVNHPGTKANPFLERAVEKSEADIDKYFISAVQTIFK